MWFNSETWKNGVIMAKGIDKEKGFSYFSLESQSKDSVLEFYVDLNRGRTFGAVFIQVPATEFTQGRNRLASPEEANFLIEKLGGHVKGIL